MHTTIQLLLQPFFPPFLAQILSRGVRVLCLRNLFWHVPWSGGLCAAGLCQPGMPAMPPLGAPGCSERASRSFPSAPVPLGENLGNARACWRTREGNSREAGLGKGKLVQTGCSGLGVKVLESSWYPYLARGCLCGLVWVLRGWELFFSLHGRCGELVWLGRQSS